MTSRGVVKKSPAKEPVIDLVCAIAASLCASALTFLIYLLKPHAFDILVYLKFTFTALASYCAVALILSKLWVGGLRRLVPSWIPLSIFGSTVYVALRLLPALVSGWYEPSSTRPSLSRYVEVEIDAARSVIITLSLITLPVTAIIYYGDSILRSIRRWHDGAELPPSITPPSV